MDLFVGATTLNITTISIKDLYVKLSTTDSINDTQHKNVLPLCLVARYIFITVLNVIMMSFIMLNVMAPFLSDP